MMKIVKKKKGNEKIETIMTRDRFKLEPFKYLLIRFSSIDFFGYRAVLLRRIERLKVKKII